MVACRGGLLSSSRVVFFLSLVGLLVTQAGCFSMRATTGLGVNVPTVSFGGQSTSTLPPPRRGPTPAPKETRAHPSSPGSNYSFDIFLGGYIPWGFRGMLMPEIGYSLDAPLFPGKFSLGMGFLFTFPNTVTFAVDPKATAIGYTPALLLAVDNNSMVYGGLRNAIRFQFRRYWFLELQHEVLIGAPGLTQNVRMMLGFDFGLLWSVQTWTRAIRGLFNRISAPSSNQKK